jgi:hypothetical protein
MDESTWVIGVFPLELLAMTQRFISGYRKPSPLRWYLIKREYIHIDDA